MDRKIKKQEKRKRTLALWDALESNERSGNNERIGIDS